MSKKVEEKKLYHDILRSMIKILNIIQSRGKKL